MYRSRVVITGMGAVTPLGIGVTEYWANLIAGRSGVGLITRFATNNLAVKIAAEVKGFEATAFLPKKLVKETDIFMQYAYAAACEALTGIIGEREGPKSCLAPGRLGLVLGTAVGGITTVAETEKELLDRGSNRLSPHFVPKMLANVAAARIAIAYGLRGPSLTINTACSSGADAVGLAAMLVRSGEADAVLAVGAESILCPLMTAGLAAARALSRQNEYPEKASRPFDAQRDGFVMGEGAGAVLVESLDHAKARGAKIEAELLAYASLTEGYHVTLPEPEGLGEITCMKRALDKAGIEPAQVGYINAHGTSTKAGDATETKAIKAVFGSKSGRIPVSSTKGATGHLMGAGGITEMIVCIKAMQENVIPPTLNYEQPDPECDLDYVPNVARHVAVDIALSNSFGFGGQNACLILGKFNK
ncbi:beta-ketoacyl-ACP synthase II [Desulfosporosinus sp. PR]|uniref:beta-ketoacyl-ACP synthase II n=1 Tax=Candidatus Desulfosporosinus nitrosoreducens TaxID=3401928 RepID=UPI0027F2210B|nr:beta-ketoacyl-ACP synthase II [Desulfosporosinus sp. PR]MDQ7092344.1 beta-ketoacyl-ACP synthase II [Desulfosporosinus sp. PR]